MTETDNKKILQNLCHLCLAGKIFDARSAIVEEAGFSAEELEELPDEGMEDYVLENVQDPTVQKMVEIESTLKSALDVVDINIATDSDDAKRAVRNINRILPYMAEEDKISAKYLQCKCYRYVETGDDLEHFSLLKEVVEKYPDYHESLSAEKVNKFLINEIKDLSVPVTDKYETIKLAQAKSPEHVRHLYHPIVAPIAELYFMQKLEQAGDSAASYKERTENYKKAFRCIGDIDLAENVRTQYADKPEKLREFRETQHHRRKLLVLSRLEKLHKESRNMPEARAASYKKTVLCNSFYKKYPWLKSKKNEHDFV